MTATPAPAPAAEAPAQAVRAGSRAGWVVFTVGLLGFGAFAIATMQSGVAGDAQVARPGSPPPAGSATASFAGAMVLTAVLFAIVLGLSWRRRRLHWSAVVAIAAIFTAAVDPLANWATYAVLDPGLSHFPLSWPWFDLAPLVEPVGSFLGGYASYYVITGVAVFWVTRLLVLRAAPSASWRARHPAAAVFPSAWVISVPVNLLIQYQWLDRHVFVYTQTAGPVLHLGGVDLPLLMVLYDPFIYAAAATLCLAGDDGDSRVAAALASRLPARPGRQRITSGRLALAAAIVMVASTLVPAAAFSVIRLAGLATTPAYRVYPFSQVKVYDPDGVLQRAGKPGPFYK